MIKIILILVFSVIALILVLTGFGFFISSLYLYLLKIFHNPPLASVFCGLALILAAILLLLIVVIIKSSLFKFKSRRVTRKLENIAENPGEEAAQFVKQYPFRTTAVALGSGVLLGFFPKLRDTLIDGVATYLQTGSVAESLKAMKTEEHSDDQE